jgi:single-strand DNA-binding protein
MAVNKVILVGNVGKNPEIKHFDNDKSVATFSLATSESYTNKSGQKVTQTEWHNIQIWGGLSKVVENYVVKGMQLYIEGKIRTRSYDDKDGNKRYVTEIIGNTMQMLGRKPDNSNQETQNSAVNVHIPEETTAEEETDDLPF